MWKKDRRGAQRTVIKQAVSKSSYNQVLLSSCTYFKRRKLELSLEDSSKGIKGGNFFAELLLGYNLALLLSSPVQEKLLSDCVNKVEHRKEVVVTYIVLGLKV